MKVTCTDLKLYILLNLKLKYQIFKSLFIVTILITSFLPIQSQNISIELKQIFTDGNKITNKDSSEIIQILRDLAIAVEEQNAKKIVKYISQEKGAYLDVKGLW